MYFLFFLTGIGKGGTDREGRLLHIVHKQTGTDRRTEGARAGREGAVQGKKGGRGGAREKERERKSERVAVCFVMSEKKNETKQLSDTSNIKNIEQKSYE